MSPGELRDYVNQQAQEEGLAKSAAYALGKKVDALRYEVERLSSFRTDALAAVTRLGAAGYATEQPLAATVEAVLAEVERLKGEKP